MRTSRDITVVAAGVPPADQGSATVPVALFGVSPNSRRSRFLSASGAFGRALPSVGETPTGAVETTALPNSRRDAYPTLRFVSRSRDRATLCRAFTLVEIIAVVAIIALLAAVITPSIIRRIDRAAWTAETANLNNIADSLTQSILRTKTVPGTTAWATNVASQMSLSVSAITTNRRRFARAFLIDPNLRINNTGVTVGGNGAPALPYTQTTNGASSVTNARVMIVSSLGRALPISTGIPTSAEFNAIWNTAEGAKPTTATWTSWAGKGEDLRIQKLNLEPLFHQLILVDRATAGARFSIDNSSTASVPPGGLGLKKYYLDGTVVGLHQANGVLQIRHLLKRSISFLFESDAWRGQIQGEQESFSTTGADFFNHAVTFIERPTNPSAASAQGASQYGVIIAMYTFMFDYIYWANDCPHFSNHGNNPSSVPEYVLLHNQGQNSGNIDRFSGDTGLIRPTP